MLMSGNKTIVMSHFPTCLNMGISSVSFPITEEYSGFEILKHYLNESII